MLTRLLTLVVLLAIGGGIYWYSSRPITSLTLTGTVTTHEIVVSAQIGGRIERLLVNEGDAVTKDQLVAVLAPAELQQERAYYEASAAGAGSQVAESEAALRLQERQQRMMKHGVGTQEQLDRARTAADVARSQFAALAKQVDAQRSAVALTEVSAEQVSVRRSQGRANRQQQAAATAQRAKAIDRIKVGDKDRRLAVGMTTYVELPLPS